MARKLFGAGRDPGRSRPKAPAYSHKSSKPAPASGPLPCTVCGMRQEHHTITSGANPDGSLRVFSFCSTAHAHQGGFTWVTPH
jgi:hypothetical protein